MPRIIALLTSILLALSLSVASAGGHKSKSDEATEKGGQIEKAGDREDDDGAGKKDKKDKKDKGDKVRGKSEGKGNERAQENRDNRDARQAERD